MTMRVLGMGMSTHLNSALCFPVPPQPSCAAQRCAAVGAADGGVVYRLPYPATITVARTAAGNRPEVSFIRQSVAIAQFGSLARLPAAIGGSSASIRLTLSPDTGMLRSVRLHRRAYDSTVADAASPSLQFFSAGIRAAKMRRNTASQKRAFGLV